ncbi:hypothetical protein C0389_07495 [bacterium]|nr:hypothetical protein [bacterium]
MNCKEVEQFLYSSKKDEINSARWALIDEHIKQCDRCRIIYENILKADSLFAKIKKKDHQFENEEYLTRSIMKKISNENHSDSKTILNYFIEIISTRSVKFALALLLLLCTLSFVYMEYSDTKQIISLEQKIGDRWNQKMIYSGVIQEEEGVLKFFYDAYKLLNGKSSFMEINRELVLMKKNDLRALLDDYNKLDEATKARLDDMRSKFLTDTSAVRSSGFSSKEIKYLRQEIERLNKELEESKEKRGLK